MQEPGFKSVSLLLQLSAPRGGQASSQREMGCVWQWGEHLVRPGLEASLPAIWGRSAEAAVQVVLHQYLHPLVCAAGKERSTCMHTCVLGREFKGSAVAYGEVHLTTALCKGTQEQKEHNQTKCQQNSDFLLVLQILCPGKDLP